MALRASSIVALALLSQLLQAEERYRLPPEEVVAIVDAPPSPGVSISPDREWMLIVESHAMPGIADVSRRMLRLAGTRIDPAANAPHRSRYLRGLVLRPLLGAAEVRIPMPSGARVGDFGWSHDSIHFAYTLVGDQGTSLYAVSVDAPTEPVLLTDRLNTVVGGFSWMPDGRSILCGLVPVGRGAEPEAPRAPEGPNVQETAGDTSPLRTYQDLLASPHDEALFEHYASVQIAILPASGGQPRLIGAPGIHIGLSPSPRGDRLLVTTVERPWSYLMPYYSFPQTIAVWGLSGAVEHVVARVPLEENVPIGGVRLGPRSVQWKPGEPATLVWVEAQDGGDPDAEAEHRDAWFAHSAPFAGDARELLRVEHRAWGMSFLPGGERVITGEFDRDRRWTRSLLHDLSKPGSEARVLDDRSMRDRYGDPGRLVSERDASGKSVVRLVDRWLYRFGSGASPEGMLPFLDRQNADTLEVERLWRCEPGAFEQPVALVEASPEGPTVFATRHETPDSPPNWRLRRTDSPEVRALTAFPDPTPQLRGIQKRLVKYERADGVPLSATLYLPADYEEGTRLPLVVWAYPVEYNDPATAGQIGSSPWRFTRISGLSHLVMLTQGYAIMDGATMPVVGDPETMNDTFIEQIVAAAQAAIDTAVELGVADGERAAVGGHSYGAFMTANLLAHCDLFRTGVARSGAYNRTLTPFGFQSERRTFWEAPEVYFAVSPFMHAQKIDEPLLMFHGELDPNSGTFPMQSKRLFQAIKGHGGTARLVMLPYESHGYRARESVLHVHAETIEWLDRYLKD